MTLLLVLLAVGAVAALTLLACCVWAWDEPVRRCGYITHLKRKDTP